MLITRARNFWKYIKNVQTKMHKMTRKNDIKNVYVTVKIDK